jgi:Family of unknown function (DUF5684)
MGVMLLLAAAFQEDTNPSGGGGGLIAAILGGGLGLVVLALTLVVIVGMRKVFDKAGKPGWASLVPIYNLIVLLEIIGKPMWWIVLFLCLGPIGWIMASLELAKVFGKETGFAVGLMFLPVIFMPMLGFGDARYVGPAAGTPARG